MALNIETVNEMVDYGLASQTSSVTFDRTRTSFDTGDYDGTVNYFIEFIYENDDTGNNRSIEVLDGAGTTVHTFTALATSTDPTRARESFTPNSGSDEYRIKLPATTSNSQLKVYIVRIIVQQVGATKTRIQVPLAQNRFDDTSGTNQDTTTINGASSSGSYTAPLAQTAFWKKDSSKFASLRSTNPFKLEVVGLTGSSSTTAYFAVYNKTDSTVVTDSEIAITTTSLSRGETLFTTGATNFDDLDNFTVGIKTSSSNSASIAKACLYIYIDGLTTAEVYYRIGKQVVNLNGAVTLPQGRIVIDNDAYTNPKYYFEVDGRESTAGDIRHYLFDASTNDSGSTGSNVSGSEIVYGSTQEIVRSSSVTITDGNRYLYRYEEVGSAFAQHGRSWLVVHTSDSAIVNAGVLSLTTAVIDTVWEIDDPTAIANLALWLDAADIDTLFQDTGGTTPVTSDAETIARWNDKSGNGYNATQATAANEPTYKTNIQNGKPVVRFDGTNDVLTTTTLVNLVATTTTAYTMFIVGKGVASGTNSANGYENEGFIGDTGGYFSSYLRSSNKLGAYNWDSNNDTVEANYTLNSAFILITQRLSGGAGGVLYLRVDQADIGNKASGVSGATTGTVQIGKVYTSYFLEGDIAEIVIYKRSLNADEITAVEDYLYSKWFATAADITVTPSAITTTLSLQAPIITTTRSVTVSSETQTTTFSLPTPTITAVKNVSIAADSVSLTSSVQAPTISTVRSVTIASDQQSTVLQLQSPTISTVRVVTVTGDLQSSTIALPTPTISGTANIAADAQAATLVLQAPTIVVEEVAEDIVVDAGATTTTLSLQAPTITGDANTSTNSQTVALFLQETIVTTTRNATITPSAIALTFTPRSPTIIDASGTPTAKRIIFVDGTLAMRVGSFYYIGI